MMDGKQFGTIAMQLVHAAQIPGTALDDAMAFRDAARALAEGRLTITVAQLRPVAMDDGNLPKLGAGGMG